MLSPVFTGIIQHLGSITSIEEVALGRSLRIDVSSWNHRPNLGDSIAVDGCCLTVAEIDPAGVWLRFDVIAQTMNVTALGTMAVGARVNLEHAVTPTTMLGGHIVQGHVDGVGRIARVTSSKAEHRLRIWPHDRSALGLIVEKGSIAVSGVSLTVAAIGESKVDVPKGGSGSGGGGGAGAGWFEVALIPTTLVLTNLDSLGEGDAVNLEYDYIAKVVVNWLTRRGGTNGGGMTERDVRPDVA